MARITVTATIERIEVRENALMGIATDIVLCDVTDSDGVALPDGTRVNQTGQMRALDLANGDRITLKAQHLDAYNGAERIATGITAVASFLASLSAERCTGVGLRLVRPSGVRRLPVELAPVAELPAAAPEG
jgi:hypothetical protein